MTQSPHSSTGEPRGDAGDQGEDALERMREQLMAISAGDVVAEAAMPLLTLAYARLGLPPEEHARYRDLHAARLLIDALGGMLDGVKGRLGRVETELRDALAQVRLAYVDVSRHDAGAHQPAGAGEPDEGVPGDARDDAAAPGGRPGAAGDDTGRPDRPGTRPSGLWVPGEPL
jgi:hypothetical protein